MYLYICGVTPSNKSAESNIKLCPDAVTELLISFKRHIILGDEASHTVV